MLLVFLCELFHNKVSLVFPPVPQTFDHFQAATCPEGKLSILNKNLKCKKTTKTKQQQNNGHFLQEPNEINLNFIQAEKIFLKLGGENESHVKNFQIVQQQQ